MRPEEVAKKFGLDIEEVKPDYYKVLNPKKLVYQGFQTALISVF